MLYWPTGGTAELDLRHAPGSFRLEWISIAAGDWGDAGTVTGGQVVALTPPNRGNWLAVITSQPY